MDGYQTTRAIRGLPVHSDVPIIAVTAKVGEGERQLCVQAGATDYIPKPVDTPELLRAIGKWLPVMAQSVPTPTVIHAELTSDEAAVGDPGLAD
jgi:CheY-like chemotaxis protein